MISYDKSQNGWDFSQATDDEKEVLMELAQDVWAKSMAYQIANQMMAMAETSPRFEPLEGNEEATIIPFPSKEQH